MSSFRVVQVCALAVLVIGCAESAARSREPEATVLSLAAYTTPREAYGKAILPAFAEHWKARTGKTVSFEQSYVGSGAQARAIVGGFEADVAALSLEPDVQLLVDKGLVKAEWKTAANGGMVTTSLVVIGVRPGNPRAIRDWTDLARPGLKVLTPSPKTSGGAMWNITALYGAALRANHDSAAAHALLSKVLANVAIMDKGARESMLTFEQGIGDAIITYENEVLTAREAGEQMDYVIPSSTILIENPAAVVDAYADRRGTREIADEFVRFLVAPEAQRLFAKYGYRPVNSRVAEETASKFPATGDVFTIADLGGWPEVVRSLFAPEAAFDRAQGAKVASR